MKIPRILLAAGASGSGKTLITCGLLQAFVNRGIKVASFKCGPDYIDPMFHEQVIGTKSANLDTFFTSGECTRYLLGVNAAKCDVAVIEGVMGYYDGVGGITTRASAYEVADVTDTAVILLVNAKGMSLSLCAYIKGFLEFKEDSHIQGVIFNQMSPMLYPRMKTLVEELGVRVLGYVPMVKDCSIESRHLGLILPEEVPQLRENLMKLAEILEESLDIEGILELAGSARPLHIAQLPEEAAFLNDANLPNGAESLPNTELQCYGNLESFLKDSAFFYKTSKPVRIGVANDEAFCFFYKDNFRLLEQMGAELVPFSPIHDKMLPENLDGVLLYGGYPELHAKALSENEAMRKAIFSALDQGMPCMAECGGFMYLHEKMEDMDGKEYPMVGTVKGNVFRTDRLKRFGYITLESMKYVDSEEKSKTGGLGKIPAHEFHYFESTNCGDAFWAGKPESQRGWKCMHMTENLLAGFPHLYYYGNPSVPKWFLERCVNYKCGRESVL